MTIYLISTRYGTTAEKFASKGDLLWHLQSKTHQYEKGIKALLLGDQYTLSQREINTRREKGLLDMNLALAIAKAGTNA
jgi:hypothetical protein